MSGRDAGWTSGTPSRRTVLERALDLPQRVLESALSGSEDNVILVRGVFNLLRQISRSTSRSSGSRSPERDRG